MLLAQQILTNNKDFDVSKWFPGKLGIHRDIIGNIVKCQATGV